MPAKQADAVEAEKHTAAPDAQTGSYEQFCRRVGIWPMTNHPAAHGSTVRAAKNKGTYQEVVHAQAKTRVQYYTTASLINVALFLQIILAAVITAVSAANGPRTALTILGAFNTVIAGSLTWVKGQGLPDRILSYANELRRVREHIEDVERQYEEQPDLRLNVEEEAKKIYKMYDDARKNAESSYAGTFKNIDANGLKGDWKTAKDRPPVPKDDGHLTSTDAPKEGTKVDGTNADVALPQVPNT